MGEELDFYRRATRKFMYEKNEVELQHCIVYKKKKKNQKDKTDVNLCINL